MGLNLPSIDIEISYDNRNDKHDDLSDPRFFIPEINTEKKCTDDKHGECGHSFQRELSNKTYC